MTELTSFNDDWQPTCSVQMLRLRATLLDTIRSFFRERNYLEVETPLLSHDIVVDAHLEPFEVPAAGERMFLQTSPEAGMKRLLAAGSGSIFQITHSFRRHEFGIKHNPEFTMIEWYGVGSSWQDQIQLTEDLVRCVHSTMSELNIERVLLSADPFQTIRYETAFARSLKSLASGNSVLALPLESLRALAVAETNFDAATCSTMGRDDLLNALLAECVEPQLGIAHPEFLHDYPATQAALATLNPHDDRTACRFELYLNGLELCNGYQELTDTNELKRRDELQNASRSQQSAEVLPGAHRMMAAMNHGLPDCSGVALGFDRLLMSLLGETNIQKVIPFPINRA